MNMTNEEYNEYIKKKQPRSPLGIDMLRAFLVGGLICAGAGTLVPITGFANSIVAPALEFKRDARCIIRIVRENRDG